MTSGYDCSVHAGADRVLSVAPVIEELRRSSGLEGDRTTHPSWFVSRTVAWNNDPIAVLLRQDDRPVAAVLFYGRQVLGVPTGVVKGGNRSGDGLVIASADQRLPAVEAATARMLSIPWVHTVLASMREAVPPGGARAAQSRIRYASHSREVRTHLSLAGGFEGLLSRIRPRSRRNYRYFRRRAENELGLLFVPSLTSAEAVQAVESLHAASMHPVPRSRALRLEAAIRGTPGYFAMGVTTPEGDWLSYISGWRQAGVTFVEWQLNHREYEAQSLSTVMRTYFLEHEAAHGVADVVFVGETSSALGRYCAPSRCLDVLATRCGLRGMIVKELVTRLRPQSHVARLMRGGASTQGELAAAAET